MPTLTLTLTLVLSVFSYLKVALEDEKRAAADRDLALKRATYKAEVNKAEAAAQVAYEIEKAKQGQTVSTEPGLYTGRP